MDGNPSSSFKSLDDRVREAGELAQRSNDWLVRDQISFIERYVSGDLKIAIRRVDTGRPNYGAICEARPMCGESEALSVGLWRNHDHTRVQIDLQKPLMLSPHVELVQGEKKIVPSLVWAQCFDDLQIASRKPLFAFSHTLRHAEPFERVIDRKVRISTWHYAVACGECGREQVEACSDAVNRSSGPRIEGGSERPIDFELEQLFARLRVGIADKFIGWCVEPGFEFLLDRWELGTGPVNSAIGV